MAIKEEGMFLTDNVVIEVKDRKTTNVLDFLYSEKLGENLINWWSKVRGQANTAGRFPWLIFHRYMSKMDCIIVGDSFLQQTEDFVGPMYSSIISCPAHDVHIYELNEFLNWVKTWDFAYCFVSSEAGDLLEKGYKSK